MALDKSSELKLVGVHPDLVRVVRRAALSGLRFRVIEGMRSFARQKQLKAQGASQTLNSRHLTGHAVDIVPLDEAGNISWAWPLYYPLAKAMKEAAKAEGVALEWGGDWSKFKDGPHWQLPWKAYPANAPVAEKKITNGTDQGKAKITATASGGFGLASLYDTSNQIQQADSHFSAGTMIGLVIGAVLIGIALYQLDAAFDHPVKNFLTSLWRKDHV